MSRIFVIAQFVALILSVAGVPGAAARAADPSLASINGTVLNFAIERNGETIGHHVVSVRHDGDKVRVSVDSEVDYRFALIPLYSFKHKEREVWQNGQLLELHAMTNDNGDTYDVSVHRGRAATTVDVNGTSTVVQPNIVPSSLWNSRMVVAHTLVDPVDGEVMAVSVADRRTDRITVRGEEIEARYYNMVGDMKRELWYDRSGYLVQVRFKGEDGSDVQFKLR